MSRASQLVAVCLAMGVLAPVGWGQQPRPERDRPEPPTITVRGRGEAAAPPDRAVIRAGAIAQREQADSAQAEVSQVMQRAIENLRQLGIPERQVQTVGLTLSPVYSTPQPVGRGDRQAEPRIVGYRAGNTIEVRLDDLKLLGQVIDVVVAAGANQVEDLSFQVKDETPLQQQALRDATRDAQAKAQAIADALGVRLAGVRQVEEAGVEMYRPQLRSQRVMMAAEARTETPVQPGEVRVEANVVASYRIAGPGVSEPARPRVEPVMPPGTPATQPR